MDYKMTPVSVTMAYVGKAWHKDNLLLIWYRKKEKKNEKIRVPQTRWLHPTMKHKGILDDLNSRWEFQEMTLTSS